MEFLIGIGIIGTEQDIIALVITQNALDPIELSMDFEDVPKAHGMITMYLNMN